MFASMGTSKRKEGKYIATWWWWCRRVSKTYIKMISRICCHSSSFLVFTPKWTTMMALGRGRWWCNYNKRRFGLVLTSTWTASSVLFYCSHITLISGIDTGHGGRLTKEILDGGRRRWYGGDS
jgi:hypothetical protein